MLDPLRDPLKDNAVVPQKYVEMLERQGWIRPVKCRECKHKKLDGPSTCKSIISEFYCDEKLGWIYQYEGEPDILDWFCADGERADSPTCGPDYCEIGGEDDADGETQIPR